MHINKELFFSVGNFEFAFAFSQFELLKFANCSVSGHCMDFGNSATLKRNGVGNVTRLEKLVYNFNV